MKRMLPLGRQKTLGWFGGLGALGLIAGLLIRVSAAPGAHGKDPG